MPPFSPPQAPSASQNPSPDPNASQDTLSSSPSHSSDLSGSIGPSSESSSPVTQQDSPLSLTSIPEDQQALISNQSTSPPEPQSPTEQHPPNPTDSPPQPSDVSPPRFSNGRISPPSKAQQQSPLTSQRQQHRQSSIIHRINSESSEILFDASAPDMDSFHRSSTSSPTKSLRTISPPSIRNPIPLPSNPPKSAPTLPGIGHSTSPSTYSYNVGLSNVRSLGTAQFAHHHSFTPTMRSPPSPITPSQQPQSFFPPSPSFTANSPYASFHAIHLPSRQDDVMGGRRTLATMDANFTAELLSPRSAMNTSAFQPPEYQSVDQFFERAQQIDSLEELKREMLDAKFWVRYILGQLAYEQEKTEHLQVVCTEIDMMRARVENEYATVRMEADKIRAEADRLTQELNKLNTERDTLIGKSFVLEQQLRSLGQTTDEMNVVEATQKNYLSSLKSENATLKSTNVKYDSDVRFYEAELATTKVKYATLMEDKDRLGKLLRYYVQHIEQCDPSLIISTMDKDKIERLDLMDRSRTPTTASPQLPVPDATHHTSGRPFGKLRDWAFGLQSPRGERREPTTHASPLPSPSTSTWNLWNIGTSGDKQVKRSTSRGDQRGGGAVLMTQDSSSSTVMTPSRDRNEVGAQSRERRRKWKLNRLASGSSRRGTDDHTTLKGAESFQGEGIQVASEVQPSASAFPLSPQLPQLPEDSSPPSSCSVSPPFENVSTPPTHSVFKRPNIPQLILDVSPPSSIENSTPQPLHHSTSQRKSGGWLGSWGLKAQSGSRKPKSRSSSSGGQSPERHRRDSSGSIVSVGGSPPIEQRSISGDSPESQNSCPSESPIRQTPSHRRSVLSRVSETVDQQDAKAKRDAKRGSSSSSPTKVSKRHSGTSTARSGIRVTTSRFEEVTDPQQ